MEFMKLTDAEELAMCCVWEIGGDVTLVQVIETITQKTHSEWKRQTVSTLLLHLVDKGYLHLYRTGKTFYYKILKEKEDYKKNIIKNFIDFWYDGDKEKFIEELRQG